MVDELSSYAILYRLHEVQPLIEHLEEVELDTLIREGEGTKATQERIKLAKKKVSFAKKQLKQAVSRVKSRWDGRKPSEADIQEQQLIPLQLVEKLIDVIDLSIADLETALAVGDDPPEIPRLVPGSKIVFMRSLSSSGGENGLKLASPEDIETLKRSHRAVLEDELVTLKLLGREYKQQIAELNQDLENKVLPFGKQKLRDQIDSLTRNFQVAKYLYELRQQELDEVTFYFWT